MTMDFVVLIVAAEPKSRLFLSVSTYLQLLTTPPVKIFIEKIFMGKDQAMRLVETGDYTLAFGYLRFLRFFGTVKVLKRVFLSMNATAVQLVSVCLSLATVIITFASCAFVLDAVSTGTADEQIFPEVRYV
eukprot:GHVR01023960.1.p2 GENE.GHVR01023960.1~~GHVR01023960.1.p2  ORF type:complete len:131 (-),score=28.49 GHVR01023960.1:70-462(-)